MKTLLIIAASIAALTGAPLLFHILTPQSCHWLNVNQLMGCGAISILALVVCGTILSFLESLKESEH